MRPHPKASDPSRVHPRSNPNKLDSRFQPLLEQHAPLYREQDLVPGHLVTRYLFWQEEVLNHHPQSDLLLSWIRGVRVHDFIDATAKGTFQGADYAGVDMTDLELPDHVPIEHEKRVDTEIRQLVERGCLARWSEPADTNVQQRPRISIPLGLEPSKPRLIWGGCWLNLMCKHVPSQADGVGEAAQCSWSGAYQVTPDHKSGSHTLALDPESWRYSGHEWKGDYYVWTVCASAGAVRRLFITP